MDKLVQNMLRTPGRPVQADGMNARERLLDAAVILFSRQGVAATPTRAIAQHCSVTPAMVQYYFSSREKLLDAVFDERISRFIDHVFTDIPVDSQQVKDVVAGLVDRIFLAVEEMPWMPSVWLRDIVSEGGVFRKRMMLYLQQKMDSPASAAGMGDIRIRFQAAHQMNELSPGIVPGLIQVSIIGLVMFPLATQGMWLNLPGMHSVDRAQIRQHAQALLAYGVTRLHSAVPDAGEC